MLFRTKVVALLASLTLLVLLGSWLGTGLESARSEAKRLREAPDAEAQRELGNLAMELTSRLDSLRRKEDARPYYHYQNLFHDPRGLSAGKSINPSPLVESTGDPLIAAHFQIDRAGRLSMPPINEELGRFSNQAELADNQRLLLALRGAQEQLVEAQSLVAMATPQPEQSYRRPDRGRRPSPTQQRIAPPEASQQPQQQEPMQQQAPMQQQQAPIQQQSFSNQAFAQNIAPNAVFLELEEQSKGRLGEPRIDETSETESALPPPGEKLLKARKKKRVQSAPEQALPVSEEPVEVSTHGFKWKAAEIEGRSELVAMRRIETPAGNLSQGFLIGQERIQSWLEGRSGVFPHARLASQEGQGAHERSLAVPALQNWFVVVDTALSRSRAEAKAAGLQSDFLLRFAPTAIIAVLLLLFLVLAIARAERLAQERSQFAAAAAHELRTPLAGLQLYGDMLADGLGDQNAREKYARHISDEAQRLGRVVSNVLGFSQMERKGINLHLREADLSQSTEHVVERMRPALEQAGMEIQLEIEPGVQAIYDEDALSRILQNLLDNAEKYSREGDRRLRVSVAAEAPWARVSISDGGPGLGRQLRQQVFKPFRRNTDSDGPAGLGLGLALARALAQQQGGDLQVRESPLGGASFVLDLPQP